MSWAWFALGVAGGGGLALAFVTAPADVPATTPPPPPRESPPAALAPSAGPGGLDAMTGPEQTWLQSEWRREEARRTAAQIADGDHASTVLARVFEHGADAETLMRDSRAFRAHIHPVAPTRRVVVTPEGPNELPPHTGDDVLCLEFGPGRFNLGRLLDHVEARAVEIRGAGSDQTTLAGGGGALLGAVRRLTIEACTVEAPIGVVAEVDRGVVHLRDVRLAPRNNGTVLTVDGEGYLLAERCQFDGTTGEEPGTVDVLRIGGKVLARFEDCDVVDHRILVWVDRDRTAQGSRVEFERCTIEETDLVNRWAPSEPPGVTVGLTTTEFRTRRAAARVQVDDWLDGAVARDGAVRSVLPSHATTAELRRAFAELPGESIGIRFATSRPPFRVAVFGRDRGRWCRWQDGRLEPDPQARSAEPAWAPSNIPDAPDLRRFLDRVAAGDDLGVRSLQLASYWRAVPTGGHETLIVYTLMADREPVHFDARTGERLR